MVRCRSLGHQLLIQSDPRPSLRPGNPQQQPEKLSIFRPKAQPADSGRRPSTCCAGAQIAMLAQPLPQRLYLPPIVAGGTVAVSTTTAAAAAGCTDTPIARVESVARLPLAAAAAALSMSPPVVSRWRYRARATAAGPAASSVNGTSRESAPPPRQYDGVDTSEPRAESLSFVPPPSPTSSCRCLPIVFFLDPASLSCIHPGCFVFRESKGGTVRWNTLHQSGQETPDYTKKGWLCCCTVLLMDSFALDWAIGGCFLLWRS